MTVAADYVTIADSTATATDTVVALAEAVRFASTDGFTEIRTGHDVNQ